MAKTKLVAAVAIAAVMASGAQTKTGHHIIANVTAATGGSTSANVALGQRLAAGRGWTGSQWSCLDSLWQRESGWSDTADTRSTHSGGDTWSSATFAYGIPQARPATKLPKAGQPSDLGGHSSPRAQIRWGLGYISGLYGTPCSAWAHETSNGWY